ncbi:uncharacterized protein LOC123890806 [Trifolium pratense]|nr:uncharacterized protein LOC123890806 [Trifolium pratense]
MEMRSPISAKEVQRLTGRIASLTRFLPCSADKNLPFFQLLRKNEKFCWTEECEGAFQKLKEFLTTPPILVKPKLGTPLILYLAVSEKACSSVLVQEEGKEQKPVYFTSKVLHGAELRYQKIEKVALALLSSARRLRPYFQSHTIIVRSDQPIRQVLQKPDLAGRMVTWSVELSEFDIIFEPRGAIKAQALADFIVEMTTEKGSLAPVSWILSVDGSSNLKGSGAGVTLEGPDGVLIEQSLRFEFKASNNQAEYEALVAGMRLALEVGVKELEARSDSQLVTGQVTGSFQTKDPQLSKYLEEVAKLIQKFKSFKLSHVPRDQNSRADLLARLASTKRPGSNRSVIQETLARPSIDQEELLFVTEELESWMGDIIRYLKEDQLPGQENEALRVKKKATKFVIISDQLFKRGFSSPLLKCLAPKQAEYVIAEVHEGVCGSHIGGRALAAKVLRAGYYWPTMKEDCADYVKKCDKCQRFSNLHHAPPEHLSSVVSPWPFFKWGVDILGPFPEAAGQVKFLVVAVDYFTKWIEAEPVATITAERIRKFYWKKIICRFGLPAVLVTDNGTQFASSRVADFCKEWGIKLSFTSVEHPQTNGQAESANKVILQGLKKRLEAAKGLWVEELPMVLWSYHTTPHSSTQETPFKMVYGSDAMIPIEINEPSARVLFARLEENSINLQANLDLQDEVRNRAHVKEEACKRRAARRYDSKVKKRIIKEGDLVLRRKPGVKTPGKLFPH